MFSPVQRRAYFRKLFYYQVDLLPKVFDMRAVTIAILTLIMITPAGAKSTDAPAAQGFSKVELVRETAMAGVIKLLGWSAGNSYFAKKDGTVSVAGKDGKEILALQAKDSKGAAMLKKPEAVAVSGEVIYVVDSETNRVVMFTMQGKYQESFGARKSGFFGKGDGLDAPRGIAIHEGIVYVADSGNGRIQLFGINGVFLATLEIDS